MSVNLRSIVCASAVAIGCATAAPAALADGLPLPLDASFDGVVSTDGEDRYATVAAGGDTLALRIETDGGKIVRDRLLQGTLTVPAVAYDGTASGIANDGRTLVQIRPRRSFPRQSTTFAVLDAERLKARDQFTLDGDFSFDALSPDGRVLYLIEYPDPRDPTAYQVRAYDLERGELRPDPVIDPREPDEEMAGSPVTRAVSPDGHWAYTLYDPLSKHHPPFVHALDTARGVAVCIDLDQLAGHRQLWRLALEPSADGATLAVVERGEVVTSVDLEAVGAGEASEDDQAAGTEAEGSATTVGAAVVGIGGLVLIVALPIARSRAARRRADEQNPGGSG